MRRTDDFDFRGYVSRARHPAPPPYALPAASPSTPAGRLARRLARGNAETATGALGPSPAKLGDDARARLERLVGECVAALGGRAPRLVVSAGARSDANAYGTNEDAVLVVPKRFVDLLDDAELGFLLGHLVGHVRCGHPLELARRDLQGILLGAIPTRGRAHQDAVQRWALRARISADRAGLLVGRSLRGAARCLLATGAEPGARIDEAGLDEWIADPARARLPVTEITKEMRTELRLRLRALQRFATSALYREEGGDPIEAINRDTLALLSEG
jgi:hypothetical protein